MTVLDTATPTSVFQNHDAWTTYLATLQFTGQLVGGTPSDPKLIEGWFAKNVGATDEEQMRKRVLNTLAEVHGIDPETATDEQIEAAIAASATEQKAQVFKRTPDGEPYVEGRHVKAMLKEATNIAYPRGTVKWGQRPGKAKEYVGKMVGGKDPISFVAERVFVPEQPIVIADDISGVEMAVGHLERRGERYSTIGYFEYVDRPVLGITVRVLDDCVSEEQWARIWTVAEHNGMGARRSQGAGQFVVTAWDRVEA
ncbi:MAG: hypothetical protein IT374_08985 [Polyangiaceae bacterium]|nr:hypothetical protein [Polyangiaceae bacterium]